MVYTAYLADEEGRLIINGKPSRIVLVKKPPLAAVVMVPRVYAGWSITGNELLAKLSSQFAINPDEMMCHIKHVAAYREWRVMGRFVMDVARPKAKAANAIVNSYKNDAEVEFIVVSD